MRWLCFGVLLWFFLSWLLQSHQTEGDIRNEDKMLWAIKKAEGGTHYGIKGCDSECNCRRICRITIQHYRQRFKDGGGQGLEHFIQFCSQHYVGSNDRIGQERWIKNVTYLYTKVSIK